MIERSSLSINWFLSQRSHSTYMLTLYTTHRMEAYGHSKLLVTTGIFSQISLIKLMHVTPDGQVHP